MASSCNPAGIYFDPLSDMADAQSSVLPLSIDVLHRDMRCNAAGLMPAVHAKKMLPSTAHDGRQHSDGRRQILLRCGNTRGSIEAQHADEFCHDVAGAHYEHALQVEDLRWPVISDARLC